MKLPNWLRSWRVRQYKSSRASSISAIEANPMGSAMFSFDRRNGLFLAFLLLPLWSSVALLGQEASGSISGTVTDALGSAVPGVSLTLTNMDTSAFRKTVSDSQGRYLFPSIAAGPYVLSAEHPGFEATRISGISLEVYQKITVDVRLRVGTVKQTIEVQAEVPIVDVNTASLGTLVDDRAIEDLPLNLRQVGALALTVPGTVDSTNRSLASAQGNGSGFNDESYIGAGGRSSSNLILIDGMLSRALNNGGFALNPPPDFVQEFKIQNNVYDAAFGITSGTDMNLITKSGTNDFHGGAWEYLRNRVFDARNFFAAPGQNPQLIRNQFGGDLGGPIRKDKVFFFAAYEGLRLVKGLSIQNTVPTLAQKNGDFSSLFTGITANACANGSGPSFDSGQLFDPATEFNITCSDGSTALYGTPIPNNNIATYLGGVHNLDPVAQKVLALYPLPNRGGNIFVNQDPERRQDNQIDARVDWTISEKDRVFTRYLFGNTNQKFPGLLANSGVGFGPFNGFQHFRGQNAVVGWTHFFNPSLINDLRIGYQRDYMRETCQACPRPPGTLASFGIVGLAAPNPSLELYPNISFSNFSECGDGFPGFLPDILPDEIMKIEDTITKVKGHHQLAFGGDLNLWRTKGVEDPFQVNGQISFTGVFSSLNGEAGGATTAADLADLELGYPGNNKSFFQKNAIITNLVGGQWSALFFQDNIRVNSRLTIEAGLRWEYRKQPVDSNNQISAFYPLAKNFRPGDALLLTALPDAANDALCSDPRFISGTGQCLIMTSAIRRQKGLNGNQVRQVSYGPGSGDFAPRLGLSWRPTQSDRLIVHAGGGIFYDLLITNALGAIANNNPVSTSTPTYIAVGGAPPPPNGKTQQIFANAANSTVAQQQLSLMPTPFYKSPTVYEWSLSLQSKLATNLALEVSYVGNRTAHADATHPGNGNQPIPGPGDLQLRRPWPDFGPLFYDDFSAFSVYHALNVKLEKRFSSGFQARLAYTYAKLMDDNGGNADNVAFNIQDDNNQRADYAVADLSLTHRMVFTGIWELPFGKNKRFLNSGRVKNALAGQWTVSAFASYQSGFPFTVTTTSDPSNTNSTSPRPDRVCRGDNGPKTVNEWFNTSCFVSVPPGIFRFGNSGRNILTGPHFSDTDVSLIKRFNMGERVKSEFRAEFFNLVNHPNWGTPNAVQGGSQFGHILTAAEARDIQFGVVLKF